MKKISQLIIPRLEGNRLTNPSYFEKIKGLVEQGIGGFILFGGKYQDVKKAIIELQRIAITPLFIASDLEQGLGQQVEGGTLFPNAMAIGSAINPDSDGDIKLLREAISIMALEASEIGINVVLAPVLDVNTNPKNPIVCTRAFSDNPEKVAWFGREFINGIQSRGLIACAKHFPGHGDTEMDSHIELPVIKASIERLRNLELYPFIEAIKEEVNMIMVGHLMVEVIDPDSPASLSQKIINGLLRKDLGFSRIVITDAMNMGAIRNLYQESDACLMALKAGADIILHPENPETLIEYLLSKWEEIETQVEESSKRILKTKERLRLNTPLPSFAKVSPLALSFENRSVGGFEGGNLGFKVARTLSEKAIRIIKGTPRFTENSVVIILDDDSSGAGNDFMETLKGKYPSFESIYIDMENISLEMAKALSEIKGRSITVAIFSKVSAWKGRNGIGLELYQFLKDALKASESSTIISFGSPYIFNEIEADILIAAYWDSAFAQRAVGKILCERSK
ncbi:MAG: glycoside hydrolase family 3 N-terminal domain-containing protein [Nitrospirota bacterium]